MNEAAAAATHFAFLRPDETAAEFLARTHVEPLMTGLPLLDHHVSIRPGQVVEVAGPAGSGKSDVLVQVAATCILPQDLDCVAYSGHSSAFSGLGTPAAACFLWCLNCVGAGLPLVCAACRLPLPFCLTCAHVYCAEQGMWCCLTWTANSTFCGCTRCWVAGRRWH